jgi:hypothetical protein
MPKERIDIKNPRRTGYNCFPFGNTAHITVEQARAQPGEKRRYKKKGGFQPP